MQKFDRKEAIRAWKEKKPEAGVYALRSRESGRRWVGLTPNVAAARNAWAFQQKQGQAREATLQAEIDRCGAGMIDFEVLEVLPEDTPSLNLRDTLKERRGYWVEKLGAERLL